MEADGVNKIDSVAKMFQEYICKHHQDIEFVIDEEIIAVLANITVLLKSEDNR